MDPGTAVGIISLGIQCCQGIVGFYGSFRDQDTIVEATIASADSLRRTFVLLEGIIAGPNSKFDVAAVSNLIANVKSCEKGVEVLQKELDGLRMDIPQASWKEKIRISGKRALYPFKEGTLLKLQKIVKDLRENLGLASSTVQLEAGAQIIHGIDNLALDFQTVHSDVNTLGNDVRTISTTASGIEAEIVGISRTMGDSRTSTENISNDVDRIGRSIDAAEQKREDLQIDFNFKSVMEWLCPIDFTSDHRAANKKREPSTGNWFLEGREYERWRTTSESLLWVNGNPGCGKTILASVIVQDLVAHVKLHPDSIVLFFYFSFSDSQKQKYSKYLTSLIAQFCHSRRRIPQRLQELYNRYQPLGAPVEELDECLNCLIGEATNTYLVVDALDECRQENETIDWDDMLEWFNNLPSSHIRGLHTLVTSRKEAELEHLFQSGSHLSVHWPSLSITKRKNSKDVWTYVTRQIENDWRLERLDDTIKDEIKSTLVNGADGMFRWVFCQMEAIKRLRVVSPDRVQSTLRSLPATLDETYSRILTGLESHGEAFTALQWLAFSTRPLEPYELAEACIIDPEAKEQVNERKRFRWEQLSDLLPSLVTLTGRCKAPAWFNGDLPTWEWVDVEITSATEKKYSPGSVRLAHFSVKEYLVSERIRRGNAAAFFLQAGLANSFIARSSMAYIMYYTVSPRRIPYDRDLTTFPLIDYACTNWHHHIKQSDDGSSTQMVDMLAHYLSWEPWLTNAHNISVIDLPLGYRPFESREPHASCVYYAAYLGYEAVVKRLLSFATVATVNAQGGYYGTALQAASRGGNKRIVEMLLHAGADVNLTGGKHNTALCAAAKHGYEHIVRLLISHGANVNAEGGPFGGALTATIFFNHQNIFRLLLERGASCKPISDDGRSPWHPMTTAIGEGRTDFLRMMLEKGKADSDKAYYHFLLFGALRVEHQASVKLLLDAGAELDGLDHGGETALYRAAVLGDESLAKWLIGNDVDVNGVSGQLGTALQAASFHGEINIIRLLLANGADINVEGGFYGTALQAAVALAVYDGPDLEDAPYLEDTVSSKLRLEIVELLLSSGARVNAVSGHYGTALQAAFHRREEEVIKLLLEWGANQL